MPKKTDSKLQVKILEANPLAKPRRARDVKPRRARQKKKSFNFMGLPLEVRILVYEQALADGGVGKGVIHINFSKHPRVMVYFQGFYVSGNAVGFLGILSAGKQLRAEALYSFYGHRFVFSDIPVLQTFLCRVPQATLSRIRHVSVSLWGSVGPSQDSIRTPTFALLRGLDSLQTIRLPDDLMCHLPWDRRVLDPAVPGEPLTRTIGRTCAAQLYRYCFPLFDALLARGGAEGLREAVQLTDLAIVRVDFKGIMLDITPKDGDTLKDLEHKRAKLRERIGEVRQFMFKVLIALHRNPAYRATTMKGFSICRRLFDTSYPDYITARMVGLMLGN